MLAWLEINSETIVALFGAGGAGAILIAALFTQSKKRKESKSPQTGPQALADHGANAVVNLGPGNVSVNANEPVDGNQIQTLAIELGLSLHETSKLLVVFETAGVSTGKFNDVVNVLKKSPQHAEEFLQTVKDDDKEKSVELLKVLIA